MRRKINHDKSEGLTGSLFPPASSWTRPSGFPDLSGEKVIGLDIESRDDDIKAEGPGFIRGDAHVVGVSLATLDRSWYFPLRHLGGGNLDNPEQFFGYLRDVLKVEDRFIVGANLQYELEGLASEQIELRGRLIDIQIAEALIDEEQQSYSLDNIARRHLGEGKDESLLNDAARAFGLTQPKAGIWKLPAKYVGPYAEYDAQSTLKIFAKQKIVMESENLMSIFQLECELLPLLWKMRQRGVPINVNEATQVSSEWKKLQDTKLIELMAMDRVGFLVDVWSNKDLQKIFEKNKWLYQRTEKGNPSFDAESLEAYGKPETDLICEIREMDRMRTFIDNSILSKLVKGRIHPQWKQIASDEGGTRTGRMACSNPNAQQFPASKYRTTGKPNEYGKRIRSLFISESGRWAKFDYKQQEPRILTHFANLCKFNGAEGAAQAYSTNKEMDFYQYIVDSAGIDRRVAKDMYLGLCYGMGINKLCAKLNKPREEGERIINDFNSKVPFIKDIADSCERNAQQRGYVKTLLGRRRHFNKFEPVDSFKRRRDNGEVFFPLPLKLAEERWPGVRLVRADTRKALNALIQGSAADMVKASILKVWNEGKDLPYLAVHDELDIPVSDDSHAEKILDRIEHSVTMTVPVYADMEVGEHWK